MYLKTTKTAGKQYLKLVRSFRKNGKVMQEVIANLGPLDNFSSESLSGLSRAFNKLRMLRELDLPPEESIDIREVTGGGFSCYGYLPYKYLWNKFKLPEILSATILSKHKIQYDLPAGVFSMIVNRLLSPSSKLRHYNTKQRFTLIEGDNGNELHDYYRTLEYLSDAKEEIEERLFEARKDLFNQELDVVFYDVTTYHFESQHAGELLNFGFSKANKVNEVQVVMGLLIDKEGIPVAYELFEGNTFDSKTLPRVLSGLKKRFSIRRIVLVADKGINSRENLAEIKEAGFEYIVSGRLKNMSRSLQQEVLNAEGYISIETGDDAAFAYKVISHEVKGSNSREENLICTYSSRRAENDAYNRTRAVIKADSAIKAGVAGSALNKRPGYKRFIKGEAKTESSLKYKLDEEKIDNESRFDGYYVIQTSDKSLGPLDVISQYGYLYKIEESFRLLKSTMKSRPVFHWSTKRIKGHFLICFIALLLERTLEYKLKKNNIPFTTERIKDALGNSLFAEIRTAQSSVYHVKMQQPELTTKIFGMLRIRHLPNVLKADELKQIFS